MEGVLACFPNLSTSATSFSLLCADYQQREWRELTLHSFMLLLLTLCWQAHIRAVHTYFPGSGLGLAMKWIKWGNFDESYVLNYVLFNSFCNYLLTNTATMTCNPPLSSCRYQGYSWREFWVRCNCVADWQLLSWNMSLLNICLCIARFQCEDVETV
jgi:hypothetical protein